MKKNALIFGITPDYDFALANTLLGLKKHSPNFVDDVIVFHSGVSEASQKAICDIWPGIIFTNYVFPEEYGFNEISKTQHQNLASFSIPAFSRYNAFDMLDNYSKIVWLDVDILIRRDITDLLELADETGFALSQSDQLSINLYNFRATIPNFDMYKIMYNSGTIVFGDNLKRHNEMTKWCYENTVKYADYLQNPDQAIINMLIEQFDIEPVHIDTSKYVCHPLGQTAANASIIHSWGPDKFWNSTAYQQIYPEWVEYNNIWLELLKKHVKLTTGQTTSTFSPSNNAGQDLLSAQNVAQNNATSADYASADKTSNVTVLMPVYNGEQHLQAALNSIFAQTYTNFEFLIIVEHGSSNESIEILKSCSDPRVKLHFNNERLGLAESLNVGMRVAKGEYIVRMDADDISMPERIAIQVEFMDSHPDIGVAGTWLQYFDDTELKNIEETPTDPDVYECRMLFNCSLAHSSAILRKSVFIDNNLFYDPTWHIEDHELWSRAIASRACRITNIGQVLIHYRLDDASKTRANLLGLLQDYRKLMAKQFQNNLGLKLTSEELSLNDEMTNPWGFMSASENMRCSKILKNLYAKALQANVSSKFYEQNALKKVFNDKVNKTFGIKETSKVVMKNIIKKVAKPFILPLINKISNNTCEKMRILLKSELEPFTSKLCELEWKLENTRQQVHRHIDFVQRDNLIATQNTTPFIAKHNLELATNHPVAIFSNDHIYPHGTIRDNTRYPRFIKTCEDLLPNKKALSFLDLGCSGGGLVLDAILRGHFALGLEGSDSSFKDQRAEWRLLRDNLYTCDITKEFNLHDRTNEATHSFDIISAWEVLEHISEDDLPHMMANIKKHLSREGYFIASVAAWDDIDPVSGVNWHVTVHLKDWWVQKMSEWGFTVHEGLFIPRDMPRGANNGSTCYEFYDDDVAVIDKELNFCLVCTLT